jgi:hypothetical protein
VLESGDEGILRGRIDVAVQEVLIEPLGQAGEILRAGEYLRGDVERRERARVDCLSEALCCFGLDGAIEGVASYFTLADSSVRSRNSARPAINRS